MDKFSRIMWLFVILIISIVLNIVLLTRPAFGSYTGETTETLRQDYSVASKYKFHSNGYISLTIKDKDFHGNDTERQYIGQYVKNEKKLFFYLCHLTTNGDKEDYRVEFDRGVLKRHSVFHLSEVDNVYYKGDYYSGWAITLQVILGITDLICIIKLIANWLNGAK